MAQPKYTKQQKDGFLAQFQQSLNSLNNLNDIINENTQDKQQFTTFVKEQLARVRTKIGALIQRINEMKVKLVTLQDQINQNNGGIQNKDAELAELTRQRSEITAQLTEATRLRDENMNRANALQTDIDQRETEIQRLTAENATLRNDITQLNNDINNRGNASEQQRAQEIEQLRQDNAAILQRQVQETTTQQQQLQQQIDANNTRIQDLEQQLQVRVQDVQQLQEQINQRQSAIDANIARIQELEQGISERDQRIQQLTEQARQAYGDLQQRLDTTTQNLNQIQSERDGLVSENDDLIDRIVAATGIIQNATQRLRELTDEQFYVQSKTGVQTDVEAILQELEVLIQSISNALQSGPASRIQPPPLGRSSVRSSERPKPVGILESISSGVPATEVPIPNGSKQVTLSGFKSMPLSEFMNGLYRKAFNANRPGVISKYQKAYDSLQQNNELKNTSLNERKITQKIADTLRSNGIEIKNGQLFGGKKTQKTHKKTKKPKLYKKHKKHQRYTKKIKQRGGFLYGDKKTTFTNSLTNSSKTISTNTISSSNKSQKSTNKNKNKNKNKNTVKKMY